MKRAPIVFAGTVAGLAGVLVYHPASSASTATTTTTSATTPATTTTSATTPTTSAASGTSTGSATAKTASTASNSASAAPAQTRSATGEDVGYRYGDIQVKVTMSGTRITDVSVVQLNSSDQHSQSIDEGAVPQLTDEAISAQSAKIDGVSGASYTSEAYAQSLQSALDKLGVSGSAAS